MTMVDSEMGRTYPHVRVQGEPEERGRQYGEQAAAKIRRCVEIYADVFHRWAGLGWTEVRRLASTYQGSIAAFDERYIEEIRGIACGARLDFEDILAINVRTEIMFAATAAAAPGQARRHGGECTSVVLLPVATDCHHTLVAQNWDWFVQAAETLIVLEANQDHGPRFVSVVEAGLLAKFGMNSAGLGIATNALICDADEGEPGIPYHVMLRALHDATGIADAIARLQRPWRASSANYLIAHRDGVALDIEAPPGDFSSLRLNQPSEGFLLHTNHFLSPRFAGIDIGLWLMPDSPVRLQAVREYVGSRLGQLDVSGLETAMTLHVDHPHGVCAHPDESSEGDRFGTLVSSVADLDSRQIWIADGNPCSTAYRVLDYSDFLSG